MATGVVFSEEFKKHVTGQGHPESPARMDAVARALAAPSLSAKLRAVTPRPAEKEQILLVHWEHLYDEVQATTSRDRTYLDSDTVASRDTATTAHLAVGGVLTAVEGVMEGKLSNAFALVRPPGHHAKPDKAMGFCIFNNLAIGAKYALRRYKLQRVMIIDFDVHHGNGTQKAFYTSPEVLFVSLHQSPHYPGTGSLGEVGRDEGEGYTLNVPLAAGLADRDYLRILRDVVVPVGIEFNPELILVSAGFDAHRNDPLGGMLLSHDGYAAMTGEILRLARTTCEGRAVFALEGGYHLASLERSIVSVLGVMSGDTPPEIADVDGASTGVVSELRKAHGKHWAALRDG
jgi:acetoin utilization deacetylase AcuC-like enzyme